MQNFVAPSVLIFSFELQSFFQWIVKLLTYQIYYLPLALYVLTLLFIGFILLKATVQWHNIPCRKTGIRKCKLGRDLLMPLFIKFHYWLFIILSIMMLVYVLRNGYAYFYHNHISLYSAYFWIVRASVVYFSIYVYMLLDIAVPLIKRGHSLQKAERCLVLYIYSRPLQALLKYALQFVLIFASIYVFRFVIEQFRSFALSGLFFTQENPLGINFPDAQSMRQLMINILVLPLGFLLSNLLYIPLMYLMKLSFESLNITKRKV